MYGIPGLLWLPGYLYRQLGAQSLQAWLRSLPVGRSYDQRGTTWNYEEFSQGLVTPNMSAHSTYQFDRARRIDSDPEESLI